MEEINIQSHKYRFKLSKGIFLLLIMIFIGGNISFYLLERAKWIYDEQPYPEAKEWLVPANMMLVYGTTLTKLPFIDERSFIMKPIIGLQDYFVSKWQEKLPDNDAEKYLSWYVFKFRTYLVPNAGSVILYTNDTYSFEETREANDKAWQTIEAMMQYKAKDKEFNEIRYASFLTLSYFYVGSASIYWLYENKRAVNIEAMFNDEIKMARFYRLFDYIESMNVYYEKRYPQIFKKLNDVYYKNCLNYETTDYIMDDLMHKKSQDTCNKSNRYVNLHFNSKSNLLNIYTSEGKLGKKDIARLLRNSVDEKFKIFCKTQGEKR